MFQMTMEEKLTIIRMASRTVCNALHGSAHNGTTCPSLNELFDLVFIFNNEDLNLVDQELRDFCLVCHQIEDIESHYIQNGLCRICYAAKLIITILNL